MTDLALLDHIMRDMAIQISKNETVGPPVRSESEIQDPVIRFFAEQLQPRPQSETPEPVIDV